MNRYTHFSIEEREKARCLLEQGLSMRKIAAALSRSPSSIVVSSNVTDIKMEPMQRIMHKSDTTSAKRCAAYHPCCKMNLFGTMFWNACN